MNQLHVGDQFEGPGKITGIHGNTLKVQASAEGGSARAVVPFDPDNSWAAFSFSDKKSVLLRGRVKRVIPAGGWLQYHLEDATIEPIEDR